MTNDRKEKEEELNTEYKDIDEKYRRELINLKVRQRRALSSLPADVPSRRPPRWRTRISRSFRRRSTGAFPSFLMPSLTR